MYTEVHSTATRTTGTMHALSRVTYIIWLRKD